MFALGESVWSPEADERRGFCLREDQTYGDDALSEQAAYMLRAIELAERAAGKTAPNPPVGCVLVRDGAIVGEGWHEGPGLDHAEVAAIKNAGTRASGSTAYVTLEPCNHTGRTGPCAEALKNAGVGRVIYAVADPNPLASGGAEFLSDNGIAVETGLCEDEARYMNRAWLLAQNLKRPYVLAKSAMSLDGRTATHTGDSKWITGPEAREHGHSLRWTSDAILVGVQTIIDDDPALTARLGNKVRTPIRVILDSEGRTPIGAKALERNGTRVIVACTGGLAADRKNRLEEMGADILLLPSNENGRVAPLALLEALLEIGIVRIMIEGGGRVLGSFFDEDLIDELALFLGPKVIGGGAPAFAGRGINALQDSDRFEFAPPVSLGGDLYFNGLRNRGLS